MTVSERELESGADEAIEALLSNAAPRPRPPIEHEDAVRQAVHAEWLELAQKRRQRRNVVYAMAASVVIAVTASFILLRGDPAPIAQMQVASVDKQFGEVNISAPGQGPLENSGSTTLRTGQLLETGDDSGVALAWLGGGSLRIDANTRISIESASEIYLHDGRLYFDSAPSGNSAQSIGVEFSIRTANGLVTPLGTRYLTQMLDGDLAVLVRGGEVSVTGARYSMTAGVGNKVSVPKSGLPSTSAVQAYGGDWTWIERTSPPIDTEGQTVHQFLTWVSRESGRELKFETDAADELARSALIRGYGRVELEPSNALKVVMMSTDLEWRIENGAIVVND